MWPEIIIGLGVAWVTGNALGGAIAALLPPDNAGLAQTVGLAGYVVMAWSGRKSLQRGFRGASAGFWTSTVGRFLIGRMAGAAVLFALLKLSVFATQLYLISISGFLLAHGLPLSQETAFGLLAWVYGSSFAIAWALRTPAKILIGKSTRALRRLYRTLPMGCGGSAAFAGLLEEWANPWRPGKILLGASMYDRKWLVGVKDDRHKLTISSTGGGKGRSAIIPNLITYPGNVLCIDIKGQNAAVTARRRKEMGQAVHVFAPMGAPEGLEDMAARWNPLDDLDPAASDYVEQIGLIADALVIPGGGANSLFFDQSARTVIAGIVDYLVRARPPLIAQGRAKLLENHSQGGLA